MPLSSPVRRPSPVLRRAGYLAAIAVSGALLFILNGQPGWQAVPFLTGDFSQVLGLVNFSLAAGIAVNAVYLAYDPPRLRSFGDLVTSGIGLVTATRIWLVFPFAFHGSSAGWSIAVRAVLVVAIAGSCISLVVHFLALAHRPARHSTPGGRASGATGRR